MGFSTSGREKETFFTRFGFWVLDARSSNEQTELVGDVSTVQVLELTDSEGEWQLDDLEDMIEYVRFLLTTDASAAWISSEAWSKCVRAWFRRLVWYGEDG